MHKVESLQDKLSKFDKFANAFGKTSVSKEYWAKEQKVLDRKNKLIKAEFNSISMPNQKYHRIFSL
ncbi:hypothetical protein [Aliarcobacter butzleri]|uniref:hypothetical protein n=1 Tax=Aliarcobacter butzleri TaxID=28197 RepID=UPI00263E5128|nr:hypothetical protein [Aliarcobacter butzleri]MDN5049330.1 hypothetical protein [Aliarcobacter butzleri]MDN5056475.1 hypothetical protein [Aliarcobacter butzleri]